MEIAFQNVIIIHKTSSNPLESEIIRIKYIVYYPIQRRNKHPELFLLPFFPDKDPGGCEYAILARDILTVCQIAGYSNVIM